MSSFNFLFFCFLCGMKEKTNFPQVDTAKSKQQNNVRNDTKQHTGNCIFNKKSGQKAGDDDGNQRSYQPDAPVNQYMTYFYQTCGAHGGVEDRAGVQHKQPSAHT